MTSPNLRSFALLGVDRLVLLHRSGLGCAARIEGGPPEVSFFRLGQETEAVLSAPVRLLQDELPAMRELALAAMALREPSDAYCEPPPEQWPDHGPAALAETLGWSPQDGLNAETWLELQLPQ